MQFSDWLPIYTAILDDFGFSPCRDEEGADLLASFLRDRLDLLGEARRLVRGKRAVVFGNAPCLEKDLERLLQSGVVKKGAPQESIAGGASALLAADGAAASLLRQGIVPDIVVTDLDGPAEALREASRLGSIMVVHAHGDNLDALARMVPELKRVIGTCQCRPPAGLYNLGGFTDGDRCVFLARELEASEIVLAGFDFEDESVTPRKRKKLAWARKLIDIALAERKGD
jgi:uncharacterized Rossmann fold enzyme